DRMWITFYDGTQTAADPMMLDKYGDDPDFPWSGDMIGCNRPYAIITETFDAKTWNGFSAFRFELDGIKLYDVRKDSTAGGAGAHRWGKASTYEHSTNLAVMAYNIKRGVELPGGDVWGGEATAEELPVSVWAAAMNECDLAVPRKSGGTEPQYRGGFEVFLDQEPAAILEKLLAACSGEVVDDGGVWHIRVGPPSLPVYFFTDGDLLVSEASELDPWPGLSETINGVRVSFPSPAASWEMADAPPYYRSDLEAKDRDRRLATELTLEACPYDLQGQRLARAYVEDARRFIRHTVPLPCDAAFVTPLQCVSWSSERNGYKAKLFEATRRTTELRGLRSQFVLRERDPSDYDWSSDYELPTDYPPVNRTAPPPLVLPGVGLSAILIGDAEGRGRRPALRLTWAQVEASSVSWECRVKATAVMVAQGTSAAVVSGAVVFSDGILPETTYEVRALVNLDGASDWTEWLEATTDAVYLGAEDIAPPLVELIDTAAQGAVDAQAAADVVSAQHNALTLGFVGTLDAAFAARDAAIAQGDAELGAQISSSETRLQSEIDSVSATLSTDHYTIAGADMAITSATQTLQSTLEGPSGSIGSLSARLTTEYMTSAQTGAAIAATRTSLEASISENSASIDQIQGLEVTTNTAFASFLTQMGVAANGVISGVSSFGSAVADMLGRASAAYTFRVAAGQNEAELELVAWGNTEGGGAAIRANGARFIAEKSITTPLLVVTDPTNYALGCDFEDEAALPFALASGMKLNTAASNVLNGTKSLEIGGSAGTATFHQTINVSPGEKIRVEFWAKRTSSWNGSAGSSKLRFFNATPGAGNAYVSAVGYGASDLPNTAWTHLEHQFTVPAGCTQIGVQIYNSPANRGKVFLDDIRIRKMQAGELVVDGGIKARHLDVGSVNAEKLTFSVAGSNMIEDSGFTTGEDRFGLYSPTASMLDNTRLHIKSPGEAHSGATYRTLRLKQYDQAQDGYVRVYLRPVGATTYTRDGAPMIAGRAYEFSCQIATIKCDGRIKIMFRSADGTYLGNAYSNLPKNVSSSSTNPEAWPRYVCRGVAPSRTTHASFVVEKNPVDVASFGNVESHIFMHKPMACEVPAGATDVTPYSAGSVTNNISSSNYIPGVSGWAVRSDGSAEFKNMVVRDWIQIGAGSDRLSYENFTARGLDNNRVAGSLALGPISSDHMWHIAFSGRWRRRSQSYSCQRSSQDDYNISRSAKRTYVQLQYRTKTGSKWSGWKTAYTSNASAYHNSNWVYPEGDPTFHLVGNYANVEVRLLVRTNHGNIGSTTGASSCTGTRATYTNIDDIVIHAEATVI
ncbi:phage tail protein, partial [Shimia sagamensis]